MIRRWAVRLTWAMILIGIGGAYESIQTIRENKAFASRALSATAEPTDKMPTSGPYQGPLFFADASGETIIIPPAGVPLAVRDALPSVKKTKVVYLPEKPRNVRFPEWTAAPDQHVVGSLVFLLVGIIAFFSLRKR